MNDRDVIFQHVIENAEEEFSDAFDCNSPFPDAYIRMEIDKIGDFWLSANSAGYLHLARTFAEMGIRPLENGYHFHMTGDFGTSELPVETPPEFSFEVDNSCGRGQA